jgi:hypothetical protein
MKIPTGVVGDALIDGDYRYWLTRTWNPALPRLCFLMLNPSSAAEDVDDPTIRACCTFARNLGRGGIIVVNLYAYRATDPAAMLAQPPAVRVGPDNDRWLVHWTKSAREVVCAWGADGEASRVDEVLTLLRENRVQPLCLRQTKSGHPSHPLARGKGFIPRDTRPVPYARAS